MKNIPTRIRAIGQRYAMQFGTHPAPAGRHHRPPSGQTRPPGKTVTDAYKQTQGKTKNEGEAKHPVGNARNRITRRAATPISTG